jgi:DNA-binding SARP family transcriptional activator
LLEMLWPDIDPEQVAQNLNTATTKLRKVLWPVKGHESLLLTEDDCQLYLLEEQHCVWTDVDAAFALLKEAERLGRTSFEALPRLEEADTYFSKGAFLQEEEGLWAAGRRATVDQARYRCRLWLAEEYEVQGMPGQAETALSLLLEEDPTDEDVLCRLMRLLHRQGMTHQALQFFERTLQVCSNEGIALVQTTQALAAQLQENRQQTWHAADSSYPLVPQVTLPGENTNKPQEKDIESLDTLRRAFLQQVFRFTETIAISPTLIASLSSLEYLSSSPFQLFNSDEVTPEKLQDFASLTEVCRRLSEGNELQAAEKILWAYLPRVESLVNGTAREWS